MHLPYALSLECRVNSVNKLVIFIGVTGLAITSGSIFANDSVGYVGTGGMPYIKNADISMHSEDLFISQDGILVSYEFVNVSDEDVTETILFPLPKIPALTYGDYADTSATYDYFELWVNDEAITPRMYIRTFMRPLSEYDPSLVAVDTTELFKACGIGEAEMLAPWTYQIDTSFINQKLANCDNPALDRFIDAASPYDIEWQSQVIYSWEQTFEANATTTIKHVYIPLVGGSGQLDESQYADFCVDESIKRHLDDGGFHSFNALSYILTTGANWAHPIDDFTLTVKRDTDEVVSFCWAGEGQVRKIAPGTFQIKERNFVPTQDFNVAFIE